MSAAKHTPGPWVVRSPKNDTHAFDVYASAEEHATKLHHGFWGGEATAHLIAAAPDLLAACEAALADMDETGPRVADPVAHSFAVAEMLRAAIAKASGK